MARSAHLESGFQDRLIKKLERRFPGCMVFKMEQRQGIPDLLVLYEDKWAALECKQNMHAHHQPNQDYYVNLMDDMSYAAFVYPENEEEILDEVQSAFEH